MLFNKSLSSGILPTSLKTSHAIPIYKKGPKQYVENYRSIATLPSLLKLFERIMSNKIMSQFEPLMNQNQHGFVPGRSINTNLMELITFATESFAEKCQVDVLYTDFSKAFDKVNHALLLKKMKDLSIDDGIIKWIASDLDARIMRVKINGNLSNPYLMKTGVPAGSILGPILFLIYINDLPSVISNYCLVLLFADDCKLIMRVRTIEDAIKFQAEIDKLNNWCISNKLAVNKDKCVILTLSRTDNKIVKHYHMNDAPLKRVDSYRDLGIIVDEKLSFKNHMESLVAACNSTMGFIKP